MHPAHQQAPTVAPPAFTSERAWAVLERACHVAGQDAAGAELLRFGSNAIFRLAGRSRSVVVRVGRDRTRLPVAGRELCVSRWLNGKGGGVPATRVYEEVADQPRVVDAHPVTFWHAVDAGPADPTVGDLARLLRGLHALPASACPLPRLDPLVEVRSRLDRGLDIAAADHDFLRSRCDALDALIPDLEYVLAPGPVHGDAHTGNLLGGRDAAVLSDFEMCAVGAREWDLVPLAVAVVRLGLPERYWRAFVDGYRFDVRAWSGFPVLREARELGMTTWLAQNVGESPDIAAEVALRLESLRNGDGDRAWTAF